MQVCTLIDPDIRGPRNTGFSQSHVGKALATSGKKSPNCSSTVTSTSANSAPVRSAATKAMTKASGHQKARKAGHQIVTVPPHTDEVQPPDYRGVCRGVEDAVIAELPGTSGSRRKNSGTVSLLTT